MREFYREAERILDIEGHDSFIQDMANQMKGRELSFTDGTCYALCDNAHSKGDLDLSAPQATCIDCASISEVGSRTCRVRTNNECQCNS